MRDEGPGLLRDPGELRLLLLMEWLLLLAGVALAFANGANDNIKGVATLYGSAELGSKYQGQQVPTPSRVHLDYDGT